MCITLSRHSDKLPMARQVVNYDATETKTWFGLSETLAQTPKLHKQKPLLLDPPRTPGMCEVPTPTYPLTITIQLYNIA